MIMTNQCKLSYILLIACFALAMPMMLNVVAAETPVPTTATPLLFPSPTPSTEGRLEALESQVSSLVEKTKDSQKDIWDKIDSISGLISGGLIAIIGLVATYVYRGKQHATEKARGERQISILEAQTIQSFMPQLQSGDEKAVEAALLTIAGLGNIELATRLATLYRTEGAVSALSKIASSPDSATAQQAEKSLEQIVSSIELSALRKLRLVLEEVEDSDAEIADYVFVSGSYGYNIYRTELDVMVRKGWVQVLDDKIRITEKGKRIAGGEDSIPYPHSK